MDPRNIEKNHLLIPVDLCSQLLTKRMAGPGALLLYLKFMTSGHFKLSNQLRNDIQQDLSISERTIRRYITLLLRAKYLTLNGNSGSYRLVSFHKIHKRSGGVSTRAAVLKPTDLSHFKAFAAATVITRTAIKLNRNGESGSPVRDNGWRTRTSDPALSQFLTCPNGYLAKVLKISQSSAKNLKALAQSAGYLRVTHQFEATGFPASQRSNFMAANEKLSHRTRIRNEMIFLQQPDSIYSTVQLRKKRSLRSPNIYTKRIPGQNLIRKEGGLEGER